MSSNEIQIIENTTNNFCVYPGQCQAQNAYIYICPEDNKMYSDYSGDIGSSCSTYVWNQRELRFDIPSTLTTTCINALMDEIKHLAQRICDGYDCEWNGSNYIGTYTEDAQEAIDALTEMFETHDFHTESLCVYESVYEYLEGSSLSEWIKDAKAKSFSDLYKYAEDGANEMAEVCVDFNEESIIVYIAEEIEEGNIDHIQLPSWITEEPYIAEVISSIMD